MSMLYLLVVQCQLCIKNEMNVICLFTTFDSKPPLLSPLIAVAEKYYFLTSIVVKTSLSKHKLRYKITIMVVKDSLHSIA